MTNPIEYIKYVVLEAQFQIYKLADRLGINSEVKLPNLFISYRKDGYGISKSWRTSDGYANAYSHGIKTYNKYVASGYVNHRDDGPAVIRNHGKTTEYHIDGKHIKALDDKHIYGKENLAKYLTLV
jgi:hypothetical protein